MDCTEVIDSMGTSLADALTAVDCEASRLTAQTFGRLFASGGELGLILTLSLTLYVAFFAISLMIGRSNLGVRALIPKMVTIGLVLTFATSFAAYQNFFWNIFIGGPDWLAGVMTGSQGSATKLFAQKLDVAFFAVLEASIGQTNTDMFSPPGMMWAGALMLLLGTVGVLVTARIGLALLLALGPIFVVLALFNGTRGLFTGWLKGLVMLALAPVLAVLGGSIMLELSIPVLTALTKFRGQIDPQAAMAFFLIGAVHCALMFMSIKVTSTMVAGWQVFGFATVRDEDSASTSAELARLSAAASGAPREPATLPTAIAGGAGAGARRIDVSASMAANAANDSGAPGAAALRETRVFATSSGEEGSNASSAPRARTSGIGNRFRASSAQSLTRKSEKPS